MKRILGFFVVMIIMSGCADMGPSLRMHTLQAWMPDGCYYSEPKNQFTCTDEKQSQYLNNEGKLDENDLAIISSFNKSNDERATVLMKIYDCSLTSSKNSLNCGYRFGLPHLTNLREDWNITEEKENGRYLYTMTPK